MDNAMINYEQSAAILDALYIAGRQKGRTTAILQLAIADVVNNPVIVAADHRQAYNMQRIVDRLAGGVRSDISVVPAQNPNLVRGARSVFVDHHTVEVALGDALRREAALIEQCASLEKDVDRRRRQHLDVLHHIAVAGADAANIARTMIDAYESYDLPGGGCDEL